jgi:HlyD family secretion protein
MKRTIVIPLVLVILAAGAYAAYRTYPRAERSNTLTLYGNVDVRQVDLSFKVGGRIATLAVDEGDRVKAGQAVATLDKRYFEDDLRVARARQAAQGANLAKLEHGSRPEEIAQARANVDLATANLDNDRTTLGRQKELVTTAVSSRQNYDNANASYQQSLARLAYAAQALRLAEEGPRAEDIEAARAQFALETANVSTSERALADADLAAPTNGVILTRVREPGAIVAPGETVFALTLDAPVWVRAFVGETDLGKIRPGQEADVTTDTHPDKAYRGHVGFISPVAEFTPKAVETRELRTDLVYRLRIIIDAPDDGLRQGMPVTVSFAGAGG